MTPQELLALAVPRPGTGRFLVALSGGPDSAVAAWVATQFGPDLCRAVHVNHGTPASPVLQKSAAAIADQLGIDLSLRRIQVPSGSSWEGRARLARWEALRDAADTGEIIVTGHHRDDLAETTLGHLLRGSGATGLAAMARDREDVWRPLLRVSRADVGAVALRLALPAAEDPANFDMRSSRNVLRHRLIPRLEAESNPRLRQALARTATALAADDRFIDRRVPSTQLVRDVFGAVKVPAALLVTAEDAVAARMVRALLRQARPPYPGTYREIVAALAVARRETRRWSIEGGFVLELEGPWLVVHRGAASPPAATTCSVPGAAAVGRLDVTIEAPRYRLVRRTSLVDPDLIGDEVVLRGADPGERIEIAAGSKLVRDVMAEATIPRRLRSAWPVADSDGRIAAIASVRSASWARGARDAGNVLEVAVRDGTP